MHKIKKLFPLAFTFKRNAAELAKNLIIQFVIMVVIGAAIGVLAKFPLIGFVFGIAGGLIDLYMAIGIILSILDYLDVIK